MLTRTPVLSTAFEVVGYEFALAPVPLDNGRIPDSPGPDDQQLIEAIVADVAPCLAGRRETWFVIDVSFLTDPLLLQLPARSTSVIIWTDGVLPFPDMLDAARAIRARGCRVGIVAPERLDVEEAWSPAIDFLVINVMPLGMEARGAIDGLRDRHPGKLIVARGVEDESLGRGWHAIPDFLSGPLLTNGEWVTPPGDLSVPQRRLRDAMNAVQRRDWSASALRHLDLDLDWVRRLWPVLTIAGDGGPGSARVGDLQTLSHASLYRLLGMCLYLSNGAYPAQWARLEQALIRARMMELLGATLGKGVDRETCFATGLLSLMGASAQTELSSALTGFELPGHAGDALRRRRGPYAPLLSAVRFAESGASIQVAPDNDVAEGLLAERHLLTGAHLDAVRWAALQPTEGSALG